ncbi:hypothetical protein K435DRAFT_804755 [Dendrothele bispora CBS 962.96]|uniref:HMG box domain-containing protein n=1 Tax=Dendrothele bispora (strain CBS 962.96) TaxID=1314807 RepID=A0A4V4HDE0_DENBC|nr:hypothetical protein K435DRAFT_804755 [Dendrothele bispora CBS 962.96]
MPKATSSKTTKAATKTAKEKPAKVDKEPRAPTPWMLFCQKNRAAWKQANPDAKGNEWMKALAEQWKDSPENPNHYDNVAWKSTRFLNDFPIEEIQTFLSQEIV